MAIPKVSVIMSVYKEPVEWLRESIDSILNQTFIDFEFIIICDNPDYKEGIELLEEYRERDKRIVLLYNKQNIGLTKSLNKGLSIARGEYIARMDADDVSLPERFERQVTYMDEHSDCGICGSNFIYFGSRNHEVKYREKITNDDLILESPFAHPTVMIRSSFLGERRYDERFRVSQDYNLWARLWGDEYYFYNIQKPLLNYRCSEQQIMAKSGSQQILNARIIRRYVLTRYGDMQGVDVSLPEIIGFDDKKRIMRKLSFQSEDRKYLLFCLYTSIESGAIAKISHMLIDGDGFKMGVKQAMQIIKYAILKMDAAKF